MSFNLFAAALAASVGAAAPPMNHQASATGADLVTLAKWTQRVEEALDRQVAHPNFMMADGLSGSVRIKFNCSESGRPAAVSLDKSSGSQLLDRAAVRAVQQIATLHPLPTGMPADQKYVAVVMFGPSRDDRWKRDVSKMQASARKDSSWFKDATGPADARVP